MSEFYGSIQGNRGMATRCGTASSGIHVSAQSWAGSVVVHLSKDDEGNVIAHIYVAEGSSRGGEKLLYRGKMSDLLEQDQNTLTRWVQSRAHNDSPPDCELVSRRR